MPIAINMTDRQAAQFLKDLQVLPLKRQKKLVRRIGEFGRDEAKRKVNAGGGVPPSKWIRARKGTNKALDGVAEKVHLFMLGEGKAIVDVLDSRYSLGQHARGYTKAAGSGGPEDRVFGDWVVIPLKRPSELVRRKRSGVTNPFIYRWTKNRRPSKVPARDILPTDEQMATNGNRIATKWAQEIVSEALSRVGL